MREEQECGTTPLALYYCYVDQDEALRLELETHLHGLQREGTITSWHHNKIMPGANILQVSNEQLKAAQIILLLISPDFLASDMAHDEMQQALHRHEAGLTHVIPLLLRPTTDRKHAPFGHLQVLPLNGLPVTKWSDHDQAFVHIVEEIRQVIKQQQHLFASPSIDPSVFLSYARKDSHLAQRLKDTLALQRIVGWVDHQASPSGSSQEERLRKAIRNARAVILVATAHTRRSRSVKAELDIAEMYQRTIYVWWAQGSQQIEVLPAGKSYFSIFDARGQRSQEALQELLLTFRKQTIPLRLAQGANGTSTTPRNPYKGLRAFSQEDAADFFGRDRLIDELVEKVSQMVTSQPSGEVISRLLTVVGASGSGKSSVVMAGLLPKLQQGILAGSQHWIYLDPIVPGPHPVEALVLTLCPLFRERSLKSIREDLEDDSTRGLHLLLTTCVRQTETKIVLLIDQLEELFTQTLTEEEQHHFLDLLLTAITEPDGPLVVVLTLRADFYDRPLQYPELGRLIEAQHVTVYPPSTQDLRAVIERPVQLADVQLMFEEGLIGDLLFDVQGQAGALPLLQFTLDQLFERREGRMLTLCAYHEIGGVKGALAQHAESTYQVLPTEHHRRLARALFLRLINPGTVEQDATKRRVALSELVVVDALETERLAQVTNAFTKARLLTANTVAGVSTIEASHEALIQAWVRLRDWLHEARDDIRLQEAISKDATLWQRHGQPQDQLYQGSQLKEALQWRTVNLPNRDEENFLQASIKERQRVFRRRMVLWSLMGLAAIGSVTPLVWSATHTPTNQNAEVAHLLNLEGAKLNLYWPANPTIKTWVEKTLVPGYKQFVKDTYGVDMTVNILSTNVGEGGDREFLKRLGEYEKDRNVGGNTFMIDIARVVASLGLLDAGQAGRLLSLLPDQASRLPNATNVSQPGRDLFTTSKGKTYALPIYRPTLSFFYNKEKVPNPPPSLKALPGWVKKNPGRFTYENPTIADSTGFGSGTVFLLMVMKTFANPDDPSTYKDGFDFLRQLQPYIQEPPTGQNDMFNLMKDQKIWLMPYWNNDGLVEAYEHHLSFMTPYFPLEGTPIRHTPLVIPRSAAHRLAALLFMNYAISDDVQHTMASEIRQFPASDSPAVWRNLSGTFGNVDVDFLNKHTYPSFNSEANLRGIETMIKQYPSQVPN
jgi:spermidine/putrescine-binding protein